MSPESGQTEDVGDNVVVASMSVGETPPGGQLDGRRSSMGDAQDTTAGRDQSSPPAKRMKRGKYISRACLSTLSTACQQRKIKGGDPCAHCKARGRVCVSAAKGQSRQPSKTSGSSSVEPARTSEGSSASNQELASRVAQLERRLDMMQQSARSPIEYTAARARRESGPLGPVHENDSQSPASAQLQRVLEPDGQSFMGELSMTSALAEVDGSLSEESTGNIIKIAVDLPRDKYPGSNKPTRKVRGWLENILERYGVVADEDEWRRYMELFFEEIHVLYPVLHPPTVWETFNGLWEYGALWPMADSSEREEKRLSVALILVLRICYWFRLDATQESARLVALAVSNAHIMGIHRQSRLDTVPCFRSQLLSRVWWCVFILDRRVAIESGRPFLIQENNTDTLLPLELSDEWLGRVAGRPDTVNMLEREIEVELSEKHTTTIPYILAMIRYSRVVGKAWELVYGLKAVSNQSVSHMIDYADTVLSNLLETLPEDLTYNPDLPTKTQFGTRKRWQVKQTMLLSTCVTFLRILIRRPSAQGKGSTDQTSDNQLESRTICASLASNILNAHRNLSDSTMKYCFPYCHYLTSCTMVMTSLVANEPALKKRHREAILAATRSLRLYCHTIWVSGKMMRWVSKLTLIARRVLQAEPGQGSHRSRRMSDAPHDRNEAAEETQPQQLTPQSGIQEFSQDGIPRSGPSNSATESSYFGHGPDGGATASKPHGGKGDQELPHMWALDGMGTENAIPELPEWVMTDFNFETISGDVFGPGNADFKNAAGNSDQMQSNGIGLEMSMGETMLDAIPNGMYSLDMSMD
ncbi:hypothetical protein Daus18300_010749 [Diaporthe australafricana]|uniref:Xylanolytic transcriptional activator regulatory domain-containing protein n=1 Tax=Diaporthe australafricana TaxID=127596 RepID=A0ABR3W982_9PEZI